MLEASMLTFFIAAFIALFTIVNPFSTASVFLSITQGDSKAKRRKMALRAVIAAAVVMIVFGLFGNYILGFFSITLDAFKIAGGVLIGAVGLKMLRAKRDFFPTAKAKKHAVEKSDVSIVPLAIPMMSGPGAMTTALVLMSEAGSFFSVGLVILAILLVCLIAYILLLKARVLEKVLGESGRKVMERIMGLIVLVIGVQFIINGVIGVFGGLGWV